MIKTEFYKHREDGVELYITYSTEGKNVKRVGSKLVLKKAIDVYPVKYEYEETDEEDIFSATLKRVREAIKNKKASL